jgi:hypothetical protein
MRRESKREELRKEGYCSKEDAHFKAREGTHFEEKLQHINRCLYSTEI